MPSSIRWRIQLTGCLLLCLGALGGCDALPVSVTAPPTNCATPAAPSDLSETPLRPPMRWDIPQKATSGAVTRCFAEAWNSGRVRFLTAFRASVNGSSEFIQASIYTVHADELDEIFPDETTLADTGFACNPSLTDPRLRFVGTATPTQPGILAPAGPDTCVGDATDQSPCQAGYRVGPDDTVVLKLTYNLANAPATSDKITIDFWALNISQPQPTPSTAELAPPPQRLRTLVVFNPVWLLADTMLVPAGEPDVTHRFAIDLAEQQEQDVLHISAVGFELGPLGEQASAVILREDGTTTCLAHIADWKGAASPEIHFSSPIPLNRGDRFVLTCHWNNAQTGATDSWWGETREICRSTLQAIERGHH